MGETVGPDSELKTMQDYQDQKLPFVKVEYGICSEGVFLAVKGLEQAKELQGLVPKATIHQRHVSEWLAFP